LEQQEHNHEEQHLNTSWEQQEHDWREQQECDFGTVRTQRKKITRMQT
jgi:hypothetical protein